MVLATICLRLDVSCRLAPYYTQSEYGMIFNKAMSRRQHLPQVCLLTWMPLNRPLKLGNGFVSWTGHAELSEKIQCGAACRAPDTRTVSCNSNVDSLLEYTVASSVMRIKSTTNCSHVPLCLFSIYSWSMVAIHAIFVALFGEKSRISSPALNNSFNHFHICATFARGSEMIASAREQVEAIFLPILSPRL